MTTNLYALSALCIKLSGSRHTNLPSPAVSASYGGALSWRRLIEVDLGLALCLLRTWRRVGHLWWRIWIHVVSIVRAVKVLLAVCLRLR